MQALVAFFDLNTQLFSGINAYGGTIGWIGSASLFFSFFVMYGLIAVVTILPLVLFLKEKEFKTKLHFLRLWLLYLGVLSGTWCITTILKLITALPRPYEVLATVTPLATAGTANSFPSLHSAIAVAIAGATSVWSRSLSELLYVIALLIMVSRIFVGAHYPLDVVCGALIGWAVARIGKNFYRKYA
jgi:membrane-associated phospholipid phosphatase